tara:strand:+ start:2009 stop:2278 length:270 start_codon:yes stop_codon:yes gene_type:complete
MQYYQPLSAEIASPVLTANGTTVGSARLVRCVNTTTTAHLITLQQEDNTIIGSMTLAGGDTCIIPKKSVEELFSANAGVRLTSITIPRG